MNTHVYEIEDRPGAQLCVGLLPGRTRPALWITSIANADGEVAVLASFHGEKHAQATVNFLDAAFNAIQRAIDFHNKGDTTT